MIPITASRMREYENMVGNREAIWLDRDPFLKSSVFPEFRQGTRGLDCYVCCDNLDSFSPLPVI